MTRKHQFLWLDLATTGLDPNRCRILEWAVVLASDDIDGDMRPIEQYSSVVAVEPGAELPEMDDYVRRMHTANGLLAECAAGGATLKESEDFMLALADTLAGPEPRGIVLAGASVHFDLAFLCVHMPRFARVLSHRVFDVNTLKACERAWGTALNDTQGSHRALSDVLVSLSEARFIRAQRWTRV